MAGLAGPDQQGLVRFDFVLNEEQGSEGNTGAWDGTGSGRSRLHEGLQVDKRSDLVETEFRTAIWEIILDTFFPKPPPAQSSHGEPSRNKNHRTPKCKFRNVPLYLPAPQSYTPLNLALLFSLTSFFPDSTGSFHRQEHQACPGLVTGSSWQRALPARWASAALCREPRPTILSACYKLGLHPIWGMWWNC